MSADMILNDAEIARDSSASKSTSIRPSSRCVADLVYDRGGRSPMLNRAVGVDGSPSDEGLFEPFRAFPFAWSSILVLGRGRGCRSDVGLGGGDVWGAERGRPDDSREKEMREPGRPGRGDRVGLRELDGPASSSAGVVGNESKSSRIFTAGSGRRGCDNDGSCEYVEFPGRDGPFVLRCNGESAGWTSCFHAIFHVAQSRSTSLRNLRSSSSASSNLRRVKASSSACAFLRASSDTACAVALR